MTEQYAQESINGMPSPLSLRAQITGASVAGLVETEAVYWPSLSMDASIEGSGISIAGDANVGSIIEFSAPGLYSANLVIGAIPSADVPINILRGVSIPVTAANSYPAPDFTKAPGVDDIGWFEAAFPAPLNIKLSSTFRITNDDLADPDSGGVNPNRQLRFSCLAAEIPTIITPTTLLTISRVSL